MSDLYPTFSVKVRLDGDDLPATQTDNVRVALLEALDQMVRDRLVVGYAVAHPGGCANP